MTQIKTGLRWDFRDNTKIEMITMMYKKPVVYKILLSDFKHKNTCELLENNFVFEVVFRLNKPNVRFHQRFTDLGPHLESFGFFSQGWKRAHCLEDVKNIQHPSDSTHDPTIHSAQLSGFFPHHPYFDRKAGHWLGSNQLCWCLFWNCSFLAGIGKVEKKLTVVPQKLIQ